MATLTTPRDRASSEPRRLRLFEAQRRFVADTSPVCAAITGVGGAKTYSGAAKVVAAADAIPGLRVLVTAPTFYQLEQACIRNILDMIPPARRTVNTNKHIITLVNGSEIHYQSADNPEHFRGPEYGMVWMDEAAYCSHRAYLTMVARRRQPVPLSQVIITSTPAGYNWLWSVLVDRPVAGTTVHRWASYDNPHLDPTYLAMLEQTYAGTDFYRQELLGEFVRPQGLVYTVPQSAMALPPPPPPYRRVVGGIDFGSTTPHAHATAAVVVAEDQAGRYHVIAEYFAKRMADEDQERFSSWLVETQQRYGVNRFVADRSQAFAIELLAAGGLRVVPSPTAAEASVLDGIALVQRRFARGGLFVYAEQFPATIRELGTYRWREEAHDGQDPRRTPLKQNDDLMDALRYAVVSLEGSAVRFFRGPRPLVLRDEPLLATTRTMLLREPL